MDSGLFNRLRDRILISSPSKKNVDCKPTASVAAHKLDRYKYQPLQPDNTEFRLLEVQSAEKSNALIKCSLRHARLGGESKPEYETISYVWGDAQSLDKLEIDGKVYQYPASSVAAIRCMRYLRKYSPSSVAAIRRMHDSRIGVRVLWIDAICIDQENLAERAQQVGCMGSIYQNSQRNLVYLGRCEDEERTKSAFGDINKLGDEINQETNHFRSLENTALSTRQKDRAYAKSGLRCSIDFDRLMGCIFALPWFCRLWVLQEAALAPSNTCFLGPFEFTLESVLRAAMWLEHKQMYIPSTIGNCKGWANARLLWHFTDRVNGGHARRKPSLTFLLKNTENFETSEPADRIYALLGMKEWPEGIHPLLKPDYSKPYHDVMRNATRCALQEKNGLELWSEIRVRSNDDLELSQFPSWVPRLDRKWNLEFDPAQFRTGMFTCANTDPQPWPLLDGDHRNRLDVLDASGFELCKVDTIVKKLTHRSYVNFELFRAWLTRLLLFLHEGKGYGGAATLLIAGVNAESRVATDDEWAAWIDYKNMIIEQKRFPKNLEAGGLMGMEFRASKYSRAFGQACVNRRIFRTRTGYFGVGPKVVQEGDVIAIIYGGEMPYILRPTDDGHYRLLGECYIESRSVMFGETVKKHGKPGVVFRLV